MRDSKIYIYIGTRKRRRTQDNKKKQENKGDIAMGRYIKIHVILH